MLFGMAFFLLKALLQQVRKDSSYQSGCMGKISAESISMAVLSSFTIFLPATLGEEESPSLEDEGTSQIYASISAK